LGPIEWAIIQFATPYIVRPFHLRYYNLHPWTGTRWMGVHAEKDPMDLWTYQEIIYETKPDVIVECGSGDGGSALYFASLCELMNKGRVVSIDIEAKQRPQHPRIQYLPGSSTSLDVIEQVRRQIHPGEKVMVSLDPGHAASHVLDELRLYSPFVTNGLYLVVEDTNINGHPVLPGFGPGPMEALDEFLKGTDKLVTDASRESHLLSFNPRGYLRRVAD
jgi:cephalosporin hydroxylase